MTLWVFIIPMVLLCITAAVSHFARSTYWAAVRLTFIATVIWLFPYFVALRLIFLDTKPFEWTELFRFTFMATIGGLAGSAVSLLVGLTFSVDRHISKATEKSKSVAQPPSAVDRRRVRFDDKFRGGR